MARQRAQQLDDTREQSRGELGQLDVDEGVEIETERSGDGQR
jgi:hypothetical protein